MAVDSTNTLTERDLVDSLTGDVGGAPSHAEAASEARPAGPPVEGSSAGDALITVDDLEKALGEIEADEARTAPSAAAPPAPPPEPSPHPAAPPPSTSPSPPQTPDPPSAAVEKPLKFVIGKKPKANADTPESADISGRPATPAGAASPSAATPAAGAEAQSDGVASEAESAIAGGPTPAIFRATRKAYRGLETGLDLLSRPVARLGPNWLRLVGVFGATTLLMSLGAMFLLPMMMPHEDAMTYLAARREAIADPPPDPAADADGGDSHGKKSDGHGGAKKDASKAARKPKSDGHGSSAKSKKADKSGSSGH